MIILYIVLALLWIYLGFKAWKMRIIDCFAGEVRFNDFFMLFIIMIIAPVAFVIAWSLRSSVPFKDRIIFRFKED